MSTGAVAGLMPRSALLGLLIELYPGAGRGEVEVFWKLGCPYTQASQGLGGVWLRWTRDYGGPCTGKTGYSGELGSPFLPHGHFHTHSKGLPPHIVQELQGPSTGQAPPKSPRPRLCPPLRWLQVWSLGQNQGHQTGDSGGLNGDRSPGQARGPGAPSGLKLPSHPPVMDDSQFLPLSPPREMSPPTLPGPTHWVPSALPGPGEQLAAAPGGHCIPTRAPAGTGSAALREGSSKEGGGQRAEGGGQGVWGGGESFCPVPAEWTQHPVVTQAVTVTATAP